MASSFCDIGVFLLQNSVRKIVCIFIVNYFIKVKVLLKGYFFLIAYQHKNSLDILM